MFPCNKIQEYNYHKSASFFFPTRYTQIFLLFPPKKQHPFPARSPVAASPEAAWPWFLP